jgi:hypothetical protein
MLFVSYSHLCVLFRRRLAYSLLVTLFGLPAAAQSVSITSPANNSSGISAVRITASTTGWISSDHLEIWDNNTKLGNVFASSVNNVIVLPTGSHSTTVNLVSSTGTVLAGNSVNYQVAENCINSSTEQCNFDHQAIDNAQNNCAPPQENKWVANPCGPGIQGTGGINPISTSIQSITESGTLPDLGNTTLDGQSLYLEEMQGSGGYSNVLFKADTPTLATATDANWVMDQYVYIPNPAAHQAFEIDVQYVWNNIWTKFYTECAFNQNGNGTGYWAVYNGTAGWAFLNGQNGAPNLPCNRSQFALPWAGSGDPTFTGWHHIVWTFKRGTSPEGYAIFVSLTFDGTTTTLNYAPTTQTGGAAGNNGDFAALIQLDGSKNPNPPNSYPQVDVYVNELNITHTP